MPSKRRQHKSKKVQKVQVVHKKSHIATFKKTIERPTSIAFTLALDVIQTTGTPSAIGFNIMLEYPTWIFSGTVPAYSQLGNIPTDYTRFVGLYDEYAVDSLVLDYRTYCPAEYAGDLAIYWTGAAGVPFYYMERDYDDDALVTTEAQALNKGPGFSLFKDHKHVFMNEKTRRSKWLNTSSINPSAVPVATGTITDQIAKRSSAKFYMPLLPNNVTIGRFYFTWNLRFKSLRTV